MSKVTSRLLRQGDIIGWEGHNSYTVRNTWPKGNRQIEIEGNSTKKSTFYKCQDNGRLGICAGGRESRAVTTRYNGWFWLEQSLDIKPDKDTARKLQASVPGEHRCKSPQRNNSKPYYSMLEGSFTWSNGIYSRDARVVCKSSTVTLPG